MVQKREKFNSRIGLLLALVGSAVGLGNMWRFPYLLGSNGGAAFLIIYLIFVFALCMPIALAEYFVGRKTKKDAFSAFNGIAGTKIGRIMGIIFFLGVFCALSFYIVVGGWIISYFIGSFNYNTAFTPEFIESFEQMAMGMAPTTRSIAQSLSFALLFLVLTAMIIKSGVVKGIEKFSKYTMPLLFVIITGIAVYSCCLPGASEGISYLFKPDFSKVNGTTLANALGQAFMSLSLGCGTVLTYASYSSDKSDSVSVAVWTIILDTAFALIAGLAIIPAVFAFGTTPGQGPELVFNTLPRVFSSMPGGEVVSIFFFFTLFIAAISSAISLLETMVACIVEKGRISRKTAVYIITAVTIVTGTLCSLSFGPLAGVKVPGGTFFDMFNIASSNVFMTVGALGIVLIVGWKIRSEEFSSVLTNNGATPHSPIFMKAMHFAIKWVAPIVIVAIIILGFVNV